MIKKLLQRLFKRDDQPADTRRSPDLGKRDYKKILHLSDLHVINEETERQWLEAAKTIIECYDPSEWVIVVTGDLVDHGKATEYIRLTDGFIALNAAGFTVYIVPGNHDYGPWGNVYRANAHKNFTYFCEKYADAHAFPAMVDFGPWRLLLLDSTAHGEDGELFARGRIGKEQIAWLESRLSDPRPTWIALHHRPYWSNIFLSIVDRKDLTDLVERRTKRGRLVKYLCGHRHIEDLGVVAAGKFLDDRRILEIDPVNGEVRSRAL